MMHQGNKNEANLDLTLDKLIVIRNSLHHVLLKSDIRELSALTGLYPYEMKQVDDATGTIVFVDPNSSEGGTAFKPKTGRKFFDDLKQ